MDELTLTQRLIAAAACPTCGARAFDLRLRCDLGLGECLYSATCTQCDARFHVIKPNPEPAPATLCLRCGGRHLEPTLQCHTRTRECTTVWSCPTCDPVPAEALAA